MSHDLRPGSEPVQGYFLIDRLGKGGFGEVWKATGPGGFQVALKFVALEENAGPVELRALEVIKDIRHPHLLGTFGSWQNDGHLIIAMELADRTLLDRFREAAGQGFPGIPAPEIFEHFLDAAKALDYLNEPRHPSGEGGPLGIQHRDVKPQNLLLVGGSVKVADFGLARVLEKSSTGHTGSMTPSYAAPEFFDRKTSSHSDQYSLAITYCHLRGGRLPFEGNPAAVIAGHLMREPDLSMIPEPERPAVARALSKAPKDRWPSCRTFIQAVLVAEGVHTSITVSPGDSGWKKPTQSDLEWDSEPKGSPSRPRWPYLVGATVVVAGLLLLAVFLFAVRKPDDPAIATAVADPTVSGPNSKPDAGPVSPKDATTAQSHVDSGLALLAKESNDKAIAEFDEAIRLDPRSAIAFAGRGFASALQGGRPRSPLAEARQRKATEDSGEALRLDPNLSLGHAARGLMLSMGASPDYTKALDECSQAVKLKPDYALAYLARAHVLFRRGLRDDQQIDMKAATKISTKAISLDSKLVSAYYLRGNCRLKAENYDGALEDFEEAHQLDPDSTQGFLLKGAVWRAKGDNDRAIHQFNLVIQKDPNSIPAYNQRAAAYEAKGDTARAEADRKVIERLRSRNP